MQNNWRVILAGFKIVLRDDFKAFCRLDAFEDHGLIDSLGNRDIAIVALIRVQFMWISFLPELLVIKRFKPFFNVVAVFKILHALIVPDLGFNTQEKSPENLIGGCTA